MKTLTKITSLLIVVCCSFLSFLGCNKDDFEKVASVSYFISGKWETVYSSYIIETDKFASFISYDEYMAADQNYKIADVSSATSYHLQTDGTYYDPGYKAGDYLYFSEMTSVYQKIKVIGTHIRYLYIKEIDSDSIVIRYYEDGVETTYNVDAYKVVKFNIN